MLSVILCSVLFGIILTLIIQGILIKRWYNRLPVLSPPYQPQYDKFSLPKELAEAIKDPDLKTKKESCVSLNLIFQFLFKELKDTRHVRSWVMRRMNAEFAEMLQTTTGRLLDKITVRDFNLGHTFPIVENVSVQSVSTEEGSHDMDELALLVDLSYHGGFQLAVDVDLVFGKSAFLSVKVTSLKGRARLQFSHIPFTHWSFTFNEEPVMDFEVESQFEGRPISQLTTIITTSIRRAVRKKHTLPYYKIRYKPFFIKPEPPPPTQDIYIHGNKLSTGQLSVSIIACSRLVKTSPESFIFCTLAIDSLPWTEMVSSRKKLWVAHDIEIVRSSASVPIGLTFREEFIVDKYEEMVVVDGVGLGSAASLADIRKNDIIVSVGTSKVSSSKHAAKLLKQVSERFTIRVERSSNMKSSQGQDFRFEEDTVSLRESDMMEALGAGNRSDNEEDDYVNITITPIDQSDSASTQSMPLPTSSSSSSLQPADERSPNASPSVSPKKGFSILSSSSGLFLRKRSMGKSEAGKATPDLKRQNGIDTSPRGSPEMQTKVEHRKSEDFTPKRLKRRRSKSDVGLVNVDNKSEKSEVGSSGSEAETLPPGNDEGEEDSIDLRKTSLVKATQEPVFQESFDFEVDSSHAYLNLCVWCKIPEKLDKQNRVVKPEKDILIGHVSIQLMDIALECLTTLQGDSQHTYQLTPAEVKAAASRNKVANLATHKGFEEHLCYGDITLAYHHKTAPLTNTERRRVEKIHQENQRDLSKQVDRDRATLKKQTEQGKHNFMGKHFQSATYCNFCLKKIWLKVAFQCRVCGMICHKKCMEKCQAQTECSRDGFEFRPGSVTTVIKTDDNKEPPVQQTLPQQTSQKTSFLSKFRKESLATKLTPKDLNKVEPKPGSSLLDVPYSRRRRNSAPDREDSSESTEDVNSLAVTPIHRTRSSTSLSELSPSAALSVDLQKKVETDTSSLYSSDSDDELNLLKFFEQQKSSQNADEVVVTAAKEMGKELYAHLDPEERRDKLDATVNKLQSEIDKESVNRAELACMERQTTDMKQREMIRSRIEKSDEKIQSLALLMLHYCAGLQHCLDQQEAQRQPLQDNDGSLGNQAGNIDSISGQSSNSGSLSNQSSNTSNTSNTIEDQPTASFSQQVRYSVGNQSKDPLVTITQVAPKINQRKSSETEEVKDSDRKTCNIPETTVNKDSNSKKVEKKQSAVAIGEDAAAFADT